jgi:proteasome regulatory subunit
MNLDETVAIDELASKSDGATGADIKAICTEAGMFAIRENRDIVTMSDLERAISKVLDDGDQKALESGPMFA